MGPCTPTRGLPWRMHSRARRCTSDLSNTFQFGRGGPGGWWIIFEPELHLGEDILVPDLAGWRRERMPDYPDTAFVSLPPDWVCEVLSASTRRLDLHDGQWLLIASAKDDDPVSTRPVRCDHLQPRRSLALRGKRTVACLTVGPRESQSRALYSANHPRLRAKTRLLGRIPGREGR